MGRPKGSKNKNPYPKVKRNFSQEQLDMFRNRITEINKSRTPEEHAGYMQAAREARTNFGRGCKKNISEDERKIRSDRMKDYNNTLTLDDYARQHQNRKKNITGNSAHIVIIDDVQWDIMCDNFNMGNDRDGS